MGAFGLRS